LRAADHPTLAFNVRPLGIEVDANEVPEAVGKFEDEACDCYAVVPELGAQVAAGSTSEGGPRSRQVAAPAGRFQALTKFRSLGA
jgi:hypothetical protein